MYFNARNCQKVDDNITEYSPGFKFTFFKNVKEVVVGDSVRLIPGLFYNCEELRSVTLGESVETIDGGAFGHCSKLNRINLPNSLKIIDNSAFYGCEQLWSIVLPNSLERIGKEAFKNCSSLTEITIPENVTNIGLDAFSGTSLSTVNYNAKDCSNCCQFPRLVTTLNIGDKVTYIPRAFSYVSCSEIVFPDSVEIIADEAFKNCSNLTKVTFGKSMWRINDKAFSECDNLVEIYSQAVFPPTAQAGSFSSNSYILATLYVPNAGLKLYKSTMPWSKFADIKTYDDPVVPEEPEEPEIPVESIKLSATSLIMDLDTEVIMVATITPEDATNVEIEWSSSNENVARIDSTGVVTACGVGNTIITARSKGGEVSATCELEVGNVEILLDGLEIFSAPGGSAQLTAYPSQSDFPLILLQWWSTDESVATVDQNGFVRIVGVGEAAINVSCANIAETATCLVHSTDMSGVESVSVDSEKDVHVYNINGLEIANTTKNLASGVYIVRRGTSITKVVIK